METLLSLDDTITAVYVGGFLAPKCNEKLFSDQTKPEKVRWLQVSPSGVSSLHDRVMQIFYELKGGHVQYGREHSLFHGHSQEGIDFPGSFPEWSAERPIHLVAHSFGGVTVRVLATYLAQGNRFEGFHTSSDWIVSITAIDSPLSGSLMVYGLGASETLTPVVRWGSVGCVVGWMAHVFEYVDTEWLRRFYDFQLDYWKLSRKYPNASTKLGMACLGMCIHSTTDNSSYDMTLQSQLAWARQLGELDSIYFLSIVGTACDSADKASSIAFELRKSMLRKMPSEVAGVDTSDWMDEGFDGLLTARTQAFPFLCGLQSYVQSRTLPNQMKSFDDVLPVERGVWYSKAYPLDHLQASHSDEVWRFVFSALIQFHAHEKAGRIEAAAADDLYNGRQLRERSKPTPKSVYRGKPGDPDMQIPKWTVSNRPVVAIGKKYAYSILFANGVALLFLTSVGPGIRSGEGVHALVTLSAMSCFMLLWGALALSPGIFRSKLVGSDKAQSSFSWCRLVFAVMLLFAAAGVWYSLASQMPLGGDTAFVSAAPKKTPSIIETVAPALAMPHAELRKMQGGIYSKSKSPPQPSNAAEGDFAVPLPNAVTYSYTMVAAILNPWGVLKNATADLARWVDWIRAPPVGVSPNTQLALGALAAQEGYTRLLALSLLCPFVVQLYGLLLVGDSLSCVWVKPLYEYTTPFTKALVVSVVLSAAARRSWGLFNWVSWVASPSCDEFCFKLAPAAGDHTHSGTSAGGSLQFTEGVLKAAFAVTHEVILVALLMLSFEAMALLPRAGWRIAHAQQWGRIKSVEKIWTTWRWLWSTKLFFWVLLAFLGLCWIWLPGPSGSDSCRYFADLSSAIGSGSESGIESVSGLGIGSVLGRAGSGQNSANGCDALPAQLLLRTLGLRPRIGPSSTSPNFSTGWCWGSSCEVVMRLTASDALSRLLLTAKRCTALFRVLDTFSRLQQLLLPGLLRFGCAAVVTVVLGLQRVRDISDAYQVFCIKEKYHGCDDS